MKLHWPPTSMDEHELFRDDETRLPFQLYPFRLEALRDEDNHATREWMLLQDNGKGGEWPILSGPYTDPFTAFRAMLDQYQAWFASRPIDQIYFIGPELRVGARIKIGFSRHPEVRLRQLQTANHQRLKILLAIPGNKYDERKYHSRWKARREQGEWFCVGQCIIDEIERLKASSPSPLAREAGRA